MGGFLSFFGGAAFRMIWGEVSSWLNKKQDHEHEMAMLELQGKMDEDRHQRSMEIARLQAELNVRQVEMQGKADVAKINAEGSMDLERAAASTFDRAAAALFSPTGIAWIDAWKAMIQPQFAQIALCLWLLSVYQNNWVLVAFDFELICSILGLFTADRLLHRRGK